MKTQETKIKLTPLTLFVLLVLIATLFAMKSRAQIIYNSLTVTGLVSMPVQTAFVITSNNVTVPVTMHNLMLTNIFTNFTYTFNYGALLVGQTGTNFLVLSSMTTNFSAANGWTNGATWIYQVPGVQMNAGVTPWGSVQVFTNPTGVIFQ